MEVNRFIVPLLTISLVGCAATVDVTDRSTGVSGQTSVATFMRHSGPIGLHLGGKTYAGRWVYMDGPGSFALDTATATNGTESASATGYAVAMPTTGNGSILMSSSEGGYLHCVFDYSQLSSTGIGACRDNAGGLYDLQISR